MKKDLYLGAGADYARADDDVQNVDFMLHGNSLHWGRFLVKLRPQEGFLYFASLTQGSAQE